MNKAINWEDEEYEVAHDKEIMKLLTEISKDNLLFETLETRMSDHLDFKEVSVWGVCEALIQAYILGRHSND